MRRRWSTSCHSRRCAGSSCTAPAGAGGQGGEAERGFRAPSLPFTSGVPGACRPPPQMRTAAAASPRAQSTYPVAVQRHRRQEADLQAVHALRAQRGVRQREVALDGAVCGHHGVLQAVVRRGAVRARRRAARQRFVGADVAGGGVGVRVRQQRVAVLHDAQQLGQEVGGRALLGRAVVRAAGEVDR